MIDDGGARPPPDEVPGVAPLSLILGRTREFVLVLTDLAAFSSGFLFTMILAIKDVKNRQVLDEWADSWLRDRADGAFELEIAYEDGRRFVLPSRPDVQADLVRFRRGWTDDLVASRTAFITPVPRRGGVTFTCAWPSRGLARQSARVDPSLLRDAQARILRLWDDAAGDSGT